MPGDLVPQRGLPYAGLAEGGQHLGDIGEEGPVGPEDQQAAAADALRVGVQQIRGPVQADSGLAGARGALHTHGEGEIAPYQLVLLGLDGGRDVPHGSDAGPLDLPRDDLARPGLAPVEVLVLQAGEIGGVPAASRRPAEPAPYGHALRITGAGLVEGAGDGGAPVDDEGRVGGVLADPQPPDVQRLVFVRAEVQPPEEQRPFRQLVHRLGLAAQLVAEDLGIGPGGGGVLADDDLFVGAVDHGGEGGAAAVVVGAFPDQGVVESAGRGGLG